MDILSQGSRVIQEAWISMEGPVHLRRVPIFMSETSDIGSNAETVILELRIPGVRWSEAESSFARPSPRTPHRP